MYSVAYCRSNKENMIGANSTYVNRLGINRHESILSKSLPTRAFVNIVTAMFLLRVETILKASLNDSHRLRLYQLDNFEDELSMNKSSLSNVDVL